METLPVYFLKSALYMTLFAGVYWFFLKNETFYRFNRIFLLTGLACAVLLPLYTFTYQVKLISAAAVAEGGLQVTEAPDKNADWTAVLLLLYSIGTCFLLLRHAFGLYKIRQTVLKHPYTIIKGCRIVETSVFKSSFSVFTCIIIDNSSHTSGLEKKLILEHEFAHVKQQHWLDLLICQLFCVFQWFNPVAWLYLHFVKQNHEFLADQAVLDQGNSAAVYRAALINHSLGTPVFALSSSFSRHDQLNRAKMMARPASIAARKFTVLLVFPVAAFFLWAFAEPEFIVTQTVAKEKQQKIRQDKPVSRPKFVNEKPVLPDKKRIRSVAAKTKPALKKQVAPVKDMAVKVLQPVSAQDSVEKRKAPSVVLSGLAVNSQPLMLLDGIEINYGLAGIKPEDIQSIAVLKGEAATALYGERGKNGVLRITSKKSGLHSKTGPDIVD